MPTYPTQRPDLLKAVRDAAQAKIKTGGFADAKASKEEIERIGGEIARMHGGVISDAPIKSDERASQKVAMDYGGDWHSIKDLARMTIVVPTTSAIAQVVAQLRNRFTASQGRGLLQIKEVTPDQDPCGYSSTTVFVRTSNGRFGEIQVNLPEIIYAKQSADSVKKLIGESMYMTIKGKYQLEGGLGHALYEVYRVAPGTEKAKQAAELSKAYYAYFRRGGANPLEASRILEAVRGMNLPHA